MDQRRMSAGPVTTKRDIADEQALCAIVLCGEARVAAEVVVLMQRCYLVHCGCRN